MTFDLVNLILVPINIGLALCLAILGVWLIIEIIRSKGAVFRSLSMSLFNHFAARNVKKQEGQQQKSEKELISVMEQLYSALGGLQSGQKESFVYGKPVMAFEMAVSNFGQEISFYLAVPRRLEMVVEKQTQGIFPEAQVEKIKDYNIFNPQGFSAGSFLTLRRSHYYPFKTYKNLESDPLSAIVNSFSKLNEEGEGAALQIIFRPAPSGWQKQALKIAREMQKNKSFAQAKADISGLKKVWQDFFSSSKPKDSPSPSPPPLTPHQQEEIKALEEKASKVSFETNIRLITSAPIQEKANAILTDLEGAFSQFNSPDFNGFKVNRALGKDLKKMIYDFSFRLFNESQKIILNTEELTSIFHLPMIELATPQLKMLKAKQAAAPVNLPKEGLIIGKNVFRGVETVVKMQRDDRRRHLYIIGQTGVGKTTLMKGMIAQDIKNNEGFCVIEPHGEFAEYALSMVPPERAEDVIYFNPADLERPIGLNMLEYNPKYPEQKTFIVNELIEIFDRLYDLKMTGGPMFEQYTRNALQLLMDDPSEGATLMEVPRVLADASFRKRLLAKCKNIVVKEFWEKEAEKAGGEHSLQNLVPYITSKFDTFIANDFMRPIIGQSRSALNFREILDNKKILLANLTKGRIGETNANLLGMVLVGKLMMAAFSRVDTPEEQRNDFFLYLDEFQNFTTESIATILSEARKYKLCLIIAHQYIKQIPEKIRDAVFGNVGSIIAMRVGAEDAEFLVKQFTPVFDQNDLINIDNFNAYVKMLVNNTTTRPFSIATYPAPKGSTEYFEDLKKLSALKYGREKELVEEEIIKRYTS